MTCTERKKKNSSNQPTGCWIKPAKRLAIYLRDDFRCVYCLADLRDSDPRDITLDHVKAKVDGGSNHENNLITSCRSCNCSRQDRPVSSFAGPEARKTIKRNTARKLAGYLAMTKALIAGKTGDAQTENR